VSSLSSAWYTEEKNFLLQKGYAVPDNSKDYRVQQDGIKRMIFNTTERLVLVIPSMFHGEKAYTPFCIDEWKEKLDLSAVTTKFSGLMQHIPWHPEIGLTVEYPFIHLPQQKEYISIPSGEYTRQSESYTSIEKLIQHPLQWFFEYQLFLSHKGGTSFPDESTLRGTIADAVVQKIFTQVNTREKWWLDDPAFKQVVSQTLDQTLLEQGVLFLEDGFKRSLIEYRKMLSNYLVNLKEIITANNFEIEGTQVNCNGTINDQETNGCIDLLLKNNNSFFIIDLKWALSTKSYIRRIEEGTDLQLALYQKIYPGANASSYFLLNEGKLLVRKLSSNLLGQAVSFIEAMDGVSSAHTIIAAEKSIDFRKKEFKTGVLEVGYEMPLEELQLGYFINQELEQLYPLQEGDYGMKKFPYTQDLNLFLGKTH